MSFWDAFYAATPSVQVFMLLAVFGCVIAVTVSLFRLLQVWRADYVPGNVMFAIQEDGDLLHLTLHRDAPVSREKAVRLLAELSATKNGPTDMQ